MGSFEVAQPPVLHEGDAATREFDLEIGAVVRCAKEDGLALEGHARFVEFQHAISDHRGLVALVAAVNERGRRRAARGYLLAQNRCKSFGCVAGQRIRHVQNGRGRAIVRVQRDGRQVLKVRSASSR